MAAINAVHTDAADARDTDWSQIAQLYDRLYAVSPTPIVALNRAIAIAELDGPEVALSIVDPLPLRRLSRVARDPGGPAASPRQERRGASGVRRRHRREQNPAEKAYLARRRDQLSG